MQKLLSGHYLTMNAHHLLNIASKNVWVMLSIKSNKESWTEFKKNKTFLKATKVMKNYNAEIWERTNP